MENKPQILKEFLDYKRTTINSESKIKDIEYYIKMLLNHTKKPMSQFNEKDLINLFNMIKDKYATGTQNGIKIYLKTFIKWYYEDYSSRFKNLDKLCQSQMTNPTYSPEQMLKKEDIEKLILNEPTFFWKSFLGVLFYGGFRPSEVCKLKWKDLTFDVDGCYIKTFSNKNHKEFIKFVPKNVAFYLEKLKTNNSEWVFPSPIKKGKPIISKAVYFRLKVLSKKSLGKQINPYLLRHSVATILYGRDDIKDDDVAKQMGHSKSMKSKYVHNNLEVLRNKAKQMWIKTEDLPENEREELQGQINTLNNQIKELLEFKDMFNNDVKRFETTPQMWEEGVEVARKKKLI